MLEKYCFLQNLKLGRGYLKVRSLFNEPTTNSLIKNYLSTLIIPRKSKVSIFFQIKKKYVNKICVKQIFTFLFFKFPEVKSVRKCEKEA